MCVSEIHVKQIRVNQGLGVFEFRAVLALPKTARSAPTHKSISFI